MDNDTEKDKEVRKKIETPVEWGSKDEDLRDIIEKERGRKIGKNEVKPMKNTIPLEYEDILKNVKKLEEVIEEREESTIQLKQKVIKLGDSALMWVVAGVKPETSQ